MKNVRLIVHENMLTLLFVILFLGWKKLNVYWNLVWATVVLAATRRFQVWDYCVPNWPNPSCHQTSNYLFTLTKRPSDYNEPGRIHIKLDPIASNHHFIDSALAVTSNALETYSMVTKNPKLMFFPAVYLESRLCWKKLQVCPEMNRALISLSSCRRYFGNRNPLSNHTLS